MRFMHFRDSAKRLRATVAYQDDGNTMYYGATVVSDSQPDCTITHRQGRSKASGRCTSSMEKKITIGWKEYEWDLGPEVFRYSDQLVAFKTAQINMIGNMPVDQFIDTVTKIKAFISTL